MGSPKKPEVRKGDPNITFVEAVRKPPKAADALEIEPEARVFHEPSPSSASTSRSKPEMPASNVETEMPGYPVLKSERWT